MFSLNDVGFLGSLAAAPAYDADAQAYITAVIAADVAAGNTSGLEVGVQDAINAFVVGCKADGIWSAIKASCILAGARTLTGALVPLVGTAPTNFNFVAGDYNRETGLVGNGSTKYLNSNRSNTADPQNSFHLSIFISTAQTGVTSNYIGTADGTGISRIGASVAANTIFGRARSDAAAISRATNTTGFAGANRATASAFTLRSAGGETVDSANNSAAPDSRSLLVFAATSGIIPGSFANARLAFYSIGESLDLALLDARVTTLINAYAAAIP
jgi:hypothetical protein